ncbi:LytR/AlgR family response regulator transcription factor [Paludibacterium paludis]|uniref:DNA-binding response regulator n=1 Tax=Paludibacterium paludis TaxID=1225769 RepID=A0A918NYV1_9NEIS|nr:LytTR family DNA-binding domain-containing protein [Paludibacterium paludis]GGY07829.1 DNA-binding response regulator [Paludibacterium paludis]
MSRLLRVLIADDEELARRLLKEYLHGHPDIEVVAECGDGLQAARIIGTQSPDLVFLDIRMPLLSGLEVLELTGRREGVIFTTAHDEHAVKAFDLHAVDYLLKPFSQARFDEALLRARGMLGHERAGLQGLITDSVSCLERILIRDREQSHIVSVTDIDYIEAQDDYIAIHTQGKTYLKTQSLGEIGKRLDPKRFVRVHRSYIINLDRLRALEKQGRDSHAARLANGTRIPVSRAGYERIRSIV